MAFDDPERRFFRRIGAVLLGVFLTPMNNRLAARLGGRRTLASTVSLSRKATTATRCSWRSTASRWLAAFGFSGLFIGPIVLGLAVARPE